MDPQKPVGTKDRSGSPVTVETVVQRHSVLLSQLNEQLTSAFSSVRGDINDLRQSSIGTSNVLENLSKQLSSLNDNFSQRFSTESFVETKTSAYHVSSEDDFSRSSQCEPNLPTPKPYEGDLSLCRGFLAQCDLIFRHQPSRYSSSEARVAFLISLLTGRALHWAVATLEKDSYLSSRYDQFIQEFRLVFDHPLDGADSASKLLTITQGSRSVADYAVEFRILAAESRWDDAALMCAFRRGLNDSVKDLIIRDQPETFAMLVQLALQVDDRLRERRSERSRRPNPPNSFSTRSTTSQSRVQPRPQHSPRRSSEAEPMQIGRSRLTPDVRSLRLRNRWCLYCGAEDHQIKACPVRPKDSAH